MVHYRVITKEKKRRIHIPTIKQIFLYNEKELKKKILKTFSITCTFPEIIRFKCALISFLYTTREKAKTKDFCNTTGKLRGIYRFLNLRRNVIRFILDNGQFPNYQKYNK